MNQVRDGSNLFYFFIQAAEVGIQNARCDSYGHVITLTALI